MRVASGMTLPAIERVTAELAGLGAALPKRGGLAGLVESARGAGAADSDVTKAVARGMGIAFVERLDGYAPSAEFLSVVPIAFARQHHVLGFMGEGDRLLLAG